MGINTVGKCKMKSKPKRKKLKCKMWAIVNHKKRIVETGSTRVNVITQYTSDGLWRSWSELTDAGYRVVKVEVREL